MEIVLKEVHVGPCRRVVTLQMDGVRDAPEFLGNLINDDPNAATSLQNSMATLTAVEVLETFRNERKFKRVAKGIYEIKVPGVRLYCFRDEAEGLPARLIIATNGGGKNRKQEQNADIARATELRERYYELKKRDDTTLRYLQLEP